MGLLASAVRAPTQWLAPQRKDAILSAIPTWDVGRPQSQPFDYQRGARDGYLLDELVFACIEFRMDAAGEAPVCGYVRTEKGDEKIDNYEHPAIRVLNNPNPFMGRARLWKITSMHMDIGGNAYWHKVRSAAGRVVEFWPLRPDRVQVIPDSRTFIGGYKYSIGDNDYFLRPEDIIHFRSEHPLNDYYGLSRLHVLAGRVDLDVWQRDFTSAFFRNAGVPFGLLNIERPLRPGEREMVREQFRTDFGGRNAFSVGVLDGGAASYTPMGLPLGEDGIAMPTLDEINEARICAVMQLSPSLIATRLGLGSSSYANRVSDRDMFWDQVQVPRYRDVDDTLTMGLKADFPDIDRFGHDLSEVRALQEDADKLHARVREDFKAGLVVWEAAVTEVGYDPAQEGMLVLQSTDVPTWTDDMTTKPEPIEEPAAPTDQPQPGKPGAAAPNGRANGVAAPA